VKNAKGENQIKAKALGSGSRMLSRWNEPPLFNFSFFTFHFSF
jgi:hypothetical protein